MKTLSLLSILGTALAQFLAAGAVQAQALNFQNYNVIVFNDLKTNSDIEGRTFVGNDFADTRSSSLGIHLLSTVTPSDRTFVVGNNLISGNPINLSRGSLYIDGSTNGRAVNYNGGGSTVVDHSIDAQKTSIQAYALAQSQSLRSLASDSVVSLPSGGQPGPVNYSATAGADGLAVFNVSAADVFNSNKIQQIGLSADLQTTHIVINVSGTSVNWKDGNFVGSFNTDYWQSHVLWNFYEATSIVLDRGFVGGILAPLATIETNHVIDGLVVANNLYTQGEVHLPSTSSNIAYEGHLAPVPEPGGVIFLVAAAGLFLVARNRRLMI